MNKTNTSNHSKIFKLCVLGVLAALTITLQVLSSFIPLPGGVSMTLALTPIVIAGALYGPLAGGLLGFIFSTVVYIFSITGPGGTLVAYMLEASPVLFTILCFVKGTAAGFAAGLVYFLLGKVAPKPVAVIVTSAVAPIVNTGIFTYGLLVFFYNSLSEFSSTNGLGNPLAVLFLLILGINFVVELITNLVLSSALTPVLAYFDKKFKKA